MKSFLFDVVFNWRNHHSKSGLYPIHIRVGIGRDRRYYPIAIPQKISSEQWRGKAYYWVKESHPYAREINGKITGLLTLLQEMNKRYYVSNQTPTFAAVFRELDRTTYTDVFNGYFATVILHPPEDLERGSLRRYKSALAALNHFRSDIHFYDLSAELFGLLQQHLRTQLKLKPGTIRGYFNAYRKVVRWARQEHYLSDDVEKHLFENVHLGDGAGPKDYLEPEEVLALHELAPLEPALQKVRDSFLIQVYTGLYYNDLKALLRTELRYDPQYGYYLYRGRTKNKQLAIIPLWIFQDAWPLISRYLSRDERSPALLDKRLFISEQAYNRQLKVLAQKLKWLRKLVNKTGRFTYTQLLVRAGVAIPVVSRTLGHRKLATTEAYFDINIREVFEGLRQVDLKRLNL